MYIDICLDEQNFVIQYSYVTNDNIMPGAMRIEVADDFDTINFNENYQSYQYINEQLILNTYKLNFLQKQKSQDIIRDRRVYECFNIIDRSPLWYASLTEQQMIELQQWYEAWLDAPKTGIIPSMPYWLKE